VADAVNETLEHSDRPDDRHYEMALRHVLNTPLGTFESFSGRWVYSAGRRPADATGIGDAPDLPGLESYTFQVESFARESAELVRMAIDKDLPLYALIIDRYLGGSMPAPARGIPVHETCSLDQAMPVAARAVLRGVTTIKIKLSGLRSWEKDLQDLSDLIENYPGLRIRIDVGGAWSIDLQDGADLNKRFQDLADRGIEYVEDPVYAPLLEDLGNPAVPIAADLMGGSFEEVLAAIEAMHMQVLILKPHLCGTWHRTFTLIDAARRRGIKVILSCLYDSPVGVATMLHLAAALGLDQYAHGLNTLSLIYPHPCPILRPKHGRIPLLTGPGLGLPNGAWSAGT
jgi:L-alanine-DL-glutamate epimerase-like enolase superfamily enzyme